MLLLASHSVLKTDSTVQLHIVKCGHQHYWHKWLLLLKRIENCHQLNLLSVELISFLLLSPPSPPSTTIVKYAIYWYQASLHEQDHHQSPSHRHDLIFLLVYQSSWQVAFADVGFIWEKILNDNCTFSTKTATRSIPSKIRPTFAWISNQISRLLMNWNGQIRNQHFFRKSNWDREKTRLFVALLPN